MATDYSTTKGNRRIRVQKATPHEALPRAQDMLMTAGKRFTDANGFVRLSGAVVLEDRAGQQYDGQGDPMPTFGKVTAQTTLNEYAMCASDAAGDGRFYTQQATPN